jgi:hypothetical protein
MRACMLVLFLRGRESVAQFYVYISLLFQSDDAPSSRLLLSPTIKRLMPRAGAGVSVSALADEQVV